MMPRTHLLAFGMVFLASSAFADKVIMKNGKVYEGRIMGETSRSILISNPPVDPTPHFLETKDIFTIVRQSHPDAPPYDTRRYATLTALVTGNTSSPDGFTLRPAAGVRVEGGFRLHPLVELDAELAWNPALSGDLSVNDGTNMREYERFFAYSGGFSGRFFPFYHLNWRMEPYVLAGYQWDRLLAKGAGDFLKGSTVETGIGCLWPWKDQFYWDTRILYNLTSYDRIQFLDREGSLNSTIHAPGVGLLLGLSYRFL